MCIVLHAALFSRCSVILYFIEYFALVCSEISVYYRLHTKFAKVFFLHLSISHSVHSGGGGLHQGGLHLGGLHPGVCIWEVCIWGLCIKMGSRHQRGSASRGLHQGGSASGGSASRRRSLHPGGSASGWVCIQGSQHSGRSALGGFPPSDTSGR